MTYICDRARHLVCLPYSVQNLHRMATDLGIKRCWFHRDHYDIPKTRIAEITAKCIVVDSRTIVRIIRGAYISLMPTKLSELHPVGSRVYWKKRNIKAIIASHSIQNGSFLNYLVTEIGGRDGQYAAYHDDLYLISLPKDQDTII